MPVKYSHVIREVSREDLISIMEFEANFKWTVAAIKVVETVNNQIFDVYATKDLSDKKSKEWGFVETLTAKDKFEARRHRRMKRYPENTYGIIVNYDQDGKTVGRVHYLYDDKNKKIAELSLQMKVIEDFLEYKNFETIDEVSEYMKRRHKELEAEYRLASKIQREKDYIRQRNTIKVEKKPN